MGHHHKHDRGTKNLRLAFFLNLTFTIVEVIGGIYTNSIAILSDAVHDLGDSLALGTGWYLQNKSTKEADAKYSFGYRRFSLLGALINSVVLLVGSLLTFMKLLKGYFIQNMQMQKACSCLRFSGSLLTVTRLGN